MATVEEKYQIFEVDGIVYDRDDPGMRSNWMFHTVELIGYVKECECPRPNRLYPPSTCSGDYWHRKPYGPGETADTDWEYDDQTREPRLPAPETSGFSWL